MLTIRKRGAVRWLVGLALVGWLGVVAASEAMALEIGKPAPDFSLPDINEKTVSLKQFRGKRIVLLEFFGAAFAPT